MKICPRCRATYPREEEQFCTVDGARLVDEEELARSGGDAMVGREIAGRYSVTGVLGRGAMGVVYKGVQRGIDRTVAIKVLKRELTDQEDLVERFRREAQAASMLQSPHTVTLYDFGQDDDGTFYLVMELLEGETLGTRIARRGRLGWVESLEIVAQVCGSLGEAHEKGIIHRDLKPDNVFLATVEGGRERAKVVDFGIARLTQTEAGPQSTLTQTGAIFGTPHYMSPEQAQGLRVGTRSDIYSLGVVLFEMLAGRRPFEADRLMLIIGQHVSTPPPSVREIRSEAEVPEAVEELVQIMLAKEPGDRFQNAGELISAVEALLGRTPSPSPSDRPSLDPRPSPVNPPAHLDAPGEPSPEPADETGGPAELSARGEQTLAPATNSPPPRSRWPLWAGGGVVVVLVVMLGLIFGLGGLEEADPPGPIAAPAAGLPRDPPARPATIELSVTVRPESALIRVDDVEVEGNPFSSRFPRDGARHRVEASAEGYQRHARFVLFDRDRDVEIELLPEPAEIDAAPSPDEPPPSPEPERPEPRRPRRDGPRETPEPAGSPPPSVIDETNPYGRDL